MMTSKPATFGRIAPKPTLPTAQPMRFGPHRAIQAPASAGLSGPSSPTARTRQTGSVPPAPSRGSPPQVRPIPDMLLDPLRWLSASRLRLSLFAGATIALLLAMAF